MNKTQLIDKIAQDTDLSKASAGKALDSIVDAVTGALKRGEDVALPGFGTFKTSHRAARNGRNPQTGETIQIAASTVATWKPGKGVKDAVNS